jgi:hypothetical protein
LPVALLLAGIGVYGVSITTLPSVDGMTFGWRSAPRAGRSSGSSSTTRSC